MSILGLPYNTRIVLLSVSLLGAGAGIVGSFAMLRRRALVGDALAHASLPGLCIALLLTGEPQVSVMLFGAAITGLLGIGVLTVLRHWTRVKEDVAIGIVLSVFFGLGVVLLQKIQRLPDVDAAGLTSYLMGSAAVLSREDRNWIILFFVVTLIMTSLFYKEFKLFAFDPGFAASQGWPTVLLDILLMGLLVFAVVVGLSSVGVVMIAALLITPAASARFWTNRLSRMLAIAAVLGAVSGALGAWISTFPNCHAPTGATIVLVSGGLFVLSWLFGSRRGLTRRLWQGLPSTAERIDG